MKEEKGRKEEEEEGGEEEEEEEEKKERRRPRASERASASRATEHSLRFHERFPFPLSQSSTPSFPPALGLAEEEGVWLL